MSVYRDGVKPIFVAMMLVYHLEVFPVGNGIDVVGVETCFLPRIGMVGGFEVIFGYVVGSVGKGVLQVVVLIIKGGATAVIEMEV